MPRPKVHTRESIASAAMGAFWHYGYEATSLQHLVRHTGASRQSIYSDFGGKRELFLAALDRYQSEVVTPAFAQVERDDADLATVEAYFRQQIALAVKKGLPGPGCLVANTMTEIAPRDTEIRERVTAHNERLRAGFRSAFRSEFRILGVRGADKQARLAASTTLVFAQGLWSLSRSTDDAAPLKQAVAHYLHMVSSGISS